MLCTFAFRCYGTSLNIPCYRCVTQDFRTGVALVPVTTEALPAWRICESCVRCTTITLSQQGADFRLKIVIIVM